MDADQLDSQSEGPENLSIFGKFCYYIKYGTDKIGDLGDHLITSAQKDLWILKEELLNWTITDQEKETLAKYSTAVISRVLYTPVILAITLATSSIKLAAGSLCMLGGFRLFTLLQRLWNTFYGTIKESCNVLATLAKKFCTNTLELLQTLATRFCDMCARITASIIRNVVWVCEKIKVALDCIYDQIAAAVRCVYEQILEPIGRLIKDVIGNLLYAGYHTVEAVGSVASGGLNAAAIVVTAVIMGVGAVIFETGVSNIISGVAKLFFTLFEGLASAVGASLDGITDGANNLLTAFQSLGGYRRPVMVDTPAEDREPLLSATPEVTPLDLELGIVHQVTAHDIQSQEPGILFVGPGSLTSKSCRSSLHDTAHQFNLGVAGMGNDIEATYHAGRSRLFNRYSVEVRLAERPTAQAPALRRG